MERHVTEESFLSQISEIQVAKFFSNFFSTVTW